jgi:hypothetical protein
MSNLRKSLLLAAVVAAALPASAGRAVDAASGIDDPTRGTIVRDLSVRHPLGTGSCATISKYYYVVCDSVLFHKVAELGGGDDIARFAAQGSVTIDAGSGDDQAYAWGLGVNVTGGAGDDLLIGSADGTASVHGGSGADRIYAYGAGTDVTGDINDDTIVLYSGAPTADGGAGADTIAMARSAYAGTISGGDGADLIAAHPATDMYSTGGATYDGGAGNDTIDVHGDGTAFGDDTVNCGPGNDTVYADPTDTVNSDCENVVLAAAPSGSPVDALPALADQYTAAASALDPARPGVGPFPGF